jgi:hypothetical protein
MTHQIFPKLENDIMKILTRNTGKFLSQYKLYDELSENLDIKDPIEKENLKVRFLIVLRQLSYLYDNVTVISKNGILSASFYFDKNDKHDLEKDDLESDNLEKDFIDIDSNNKNYMPSEQHVINFIIDEDLDIYLHRKDYKGNTILHNLIIYNDYNRIKKSFNKLSLMLYQKNNDDEYPTDLITDFKINSLILNYLINHIAEMETNIIELNNTIEDSDKQLNKITNITYEIKYTVVFLISILIIYNVMYIIVNNFE